MRRLALSALGLSIVLATGVHARQTPGTLLDLGASAFESYAELLRQQVGIPGISGALVQDGVLVWERGLGFANLETRIRATPDTPYLIADLTQPLAAVLLLQCVEQRRLALDVPLATYGLTPAEPGTTLRQVLSHTTGPTAGATFKYDAARYGQLSTLMEYCAPQPFRKSVAHRLLERLAMVDSVPGRDFLGPDADTDGLFEPAAISRYRRVLEDLAVPYKVDRRKVATRTQLPVEGLNAATGVVSTVRDLVRFDAALDANLLLADSTLAAAWSTGTLTSGAPTPAGLGWFVQSYRGTPVVWHHGLLPNAYSALVIKVPSRRATMILLANSDGLVAPFQLEAGDVTRSLFASLFLRMLL